MDFVMMWKPVFFLSQWLYWHYKAGVYVLEWVRLHMPFAHWSQRRSLFKYVTTLRNEFFFSKQRTKNANIYKISLWILNEIFWHWCILCMWLLSGHCLPNTPVLNVILELSLCIFSKAIGLGYEWERKKWAK